MSDDKLDVRPGGLEVLSTGLNLAELDLHGGEGVWDEVARYSRESLFETQVDATMSGRSAPRVWAVMESPGSGPGAAAAGLAIARVLADRGQAVVLVDGDEQEPRVTRWLGRIETEGWIDMVRFGASLHAASDPVPSDNRRGSVLGVGSFAPTGVTPDEVADLLARLRRQADDLVLVLPAKLRSQPWFEASNIKLLCWDLLSRSAADTEKIIEELDRMGARPDAVLGYGVEEFAAIQGKLREDDQEDGLAPLPPEDVEDLVHDRDPEIGLESPTVPETEPETEAVPETETETVPAPETRGEQVLEPATEVVIAAEPPVGPAAAAKPRRRSSGIFVFAAVVAVVCLVMLGVFLAGQRGGSDTGDEQTVASARMDARSDGAVPREPAPGTVEPAGDQLRTDELPAGGQTPDEPAVDEQPAAGDRTDIDPAVPPTVDAGEGDRTGDAGAPAVQAPAAPAEPEPEPEPAAREPGPADAGPVELDLTVFQLPVGQDGWALWLYSFPEPELAEAEVRQLEGLGIRAESRAVDIEGKGRWYRVYVGSFASRAAAKEAVAGLKAKLKHDWVVPARM